MEKRNASRITSSPSLKSATFLLAGWRISHPAELLGDLPVPLECHTLTMNTIVLQLSDAVADIRMLQCSTQFRIMIINAHFVADNASHALVSSATAIPTFNVEEEVVVIRNGWPPRKKKKIMLLYCIIIIYNYINVLYIIYLQYAPNHSRPRILVDFALKVFLDNFGSFLGHFWQKKRSNSP